VLENKKSAILHPPEEKVWLTYNRDWRIKEWSIPRYEVEDLAEAEFSSPDMLNFTIKEDKPVMYLVVGAPSVQEQA
jgi:hypothetical protein